MKIIAVGTRRATVAGFGRPQDLHNMESDHKEVFVKCYDPVGANPSCSYVNQNGHLMTIADQTRLPVWPYSGETGAWTSRSCVLASRSWGKICLQKEMNFQIYVFDFVDFVTMRLLGVKDIPKNSLFFFIIKLGFVALYNFLA